MSIAQLLVNALALGAAYALVALGFVLILNATDAVNFTQGDIVMAGGFVAVVLAGLVDAPGILLLPFVFVIMAVAGVGFSHLAYFPLKDRPPVSVFISTIALGIVLQNGATTIFGAEPRATPPLFSGGFFTLGEVVIQRQSIAILVVAALLILGQHLVFQRTQFGRRLRATSQDRKMAAAIGVPVHRMIALTFGIAAALGGVAGLLLSHGFLLTPTDGTNYIIKAYVAVTIGGWGSIPGAVAGAMLIALFEVIYPALPVLVPLIAEVARGAEILFSQTVATILLYLMLLAILFFRPQGLFGEVVQKRA